MSQAAVLEVSLQDLSDLLEEVAHVVQVGVVLYAGVNSTSELVQRKSQVSHLLSIYHNWNKLQCLQYEMMLM